MVAAKAINKFHAFTHCWNLLRWWSTYMSRDYSRERLAGRSATSGNAALIATFLVIAKLGFL